MVRVNMPDQGYFPLEDSRINDGCPNILSTYPQITRAPSLHQVQCECKLCIACK
jgi:hypothetical protein